MRQSFFINLPRLTPPAADGAASAAVASQNSALSRGSVAPALGTAPAEPRQLSILPRAKRAAGGSRGNGCGRARARPYLWQATNTALIAAAPRKTAIVSSQRQFERIYPGSPVSVNLHRGAEPTAPGAAARGRLRFSRKNRRKEIKCELPAPASPFPPLLARGFF